MTQDEIIRMARESGILISTERYLAIHQCTTADLERFAALVAAREREACAKVCEELPKVRTTTDGGLGVRGIVGKHLAAAIRARNNHG